MHWHTRVGCVGVTRACERKLHLHEIYACTCKWMKLLCEFEKINYFTVQGSGADDIRLKCPLLSGAVNSHTVIHNVGLPGFTLPSWISFPGRNSLICSMLHPQKELNMSIIWLVFFLLPVYSLPEALQSLGRASGSASVTSCTKSLLWLSMLYPWASWLIYYIY